MLLGFLIFQVALPLALLAWLVILPGRSLVALVLQLVAITFVLLALALIAMWAIPVWWLSWVYTVLLVLVVLATILRTSKSTRPDWRGGRRTWTTIGFSLFLIGVGSWYVGQAIAARVPPASVPLVDIANPLGAGQFIVVQGGSKRLINEHLRTLDTSVDRYADWRGQSYAIDVVGIGPWGFRARGLRPADPSAYAIFGTSLHAPCAGTVLQAADGTPDNQVPDSDLANRLGNHVILRCAEADILLAHMREGSVLVAEGDSVETGQRMGQVGNSGASGEPHLHIHAQRPAEPGAAPISGEPLMLRIDGKFLVRGSRIAGGPE